jgi:drug/metabolite transporter (DMT)-like permease
MNNWRDQLLLIFAALIWGGAFVAQSAGMDYIGPWTFLCVRSFIAFAALSALMPFLDRIRHTEKPRTETERKYLFKAAFCCGAVLCAASIFQQAGIQYTSVGKAGFLTTLYVILVPVLSVFLGRKIRWNVWLAVLLAMAGIYFLSLSGMEALALGDILLLICAFLFTGHILTIDHFSPHTDPVRLSAWQFLVCGMISFVPMLVFERPAISMIFQAAVPILYAGVMSSGAAYTLQIVSQKNLEPSLASILMSLESVFAALCGFIILHQVLLPRELLGCCLVFAGVLLAQLPEKKQTAEEGSLPE